MLTSAYIANKPAPTPINNTTIELNISAALGLKEALLDIQKEYEQNNPNVKIIFIMAAEGVLETKIEQGATAASDKVKIVATAPKNSHELIIFPGVVLGNSKHPEVANNFLNYLSSPTAINVFKKYGFQAFD